MTRVGPWEFEVSMPSPAWGEIRYEDFEIRNIRHEHLYSLRMMVDLMIHDAAGKMPLSHRHEVLGYK